MSLTLLSISQFTLSTEALLVKEVILTLSKNLYFCKLHAGVCVCVMYHDSDIFVISRYLDSPCSSHTAPTSLCSCLCLFGMWAARGLPLKGCMLHVSLWFFGLHLATPQWAITLSMGEKWGEARRDLDLDPREEAALVPPLWVWSLEMEIGVCLQFFSLMRKIHFRGLSKRQKVT